MRSAVGTAGTVTKVVRELPFAGGMLAVRKATTSTKATATDALHWQAANSQGSGITDITADTLTITRRGFTPYGQTRTGAGSGPGWTGQHGFVGGLIDTTDGYTTLGARLYNPDLGSFLSVDPVFDPADPGSWNGYGHADGSGA